MTPKLETAEYVADYRIRLRFADGRECEIDLAGELWGEVFDRWPNDVTMDVNRPRPDLEVTPQGSFARRS